jgi:hypothetical protein
LFEYRKRVECKLLDGDGRRATLALANTSLIEADDAKVRFESRHDRLPKGSSAAQACHEDEIPTSTTDRNGEMRAVGKRDDRGAHCNATVLMPIT